MGSNEAAGCRGVEADRLPRVQAEREASPGWRAKAGGQVKYVAPSVLERLDTRAAPISVAP